MKKILIILATSLTLTSYVSVRNTDNPDVAGAIKLQDQTIKDPLFEKILLELEAKGEIDWSGTRTNSIKENLKSYKSNTDWLLSKYKSEGGYKQDEIELYWKKNPFSSTVATTNTCEKRTKLNRRNLDSDATSILNTLVHERVHSFCCTHYKDQTRRTNQCDAAYIAGDLAEVICLYRMGVKELKMEEPVCPALLAKIEEYKLIIVK